MAGKLIESAISKNDVKTSTYKTVFKILDHPFCINRNLQNGQCILKFTTFVFSAIVSQSDICRV